MKPCIVTIDPEFIKEVTVKQFDNFSDRFDLDLPNDQITLDLARGHKWKSLRKLMSPTFTSGKLRNMFELMSTMANQTIEYIEENLQNGQIDVKPGKWLQFVNSDIIKKSIFETQKNQKQRFLASNAMK